MLGIPWPAVCWIGHLFIGEINSALFEGRTIRVHQEGLQGWMEPVSVLCQCLLIAHLPNDT